jgi:hypothetical protein
LLNNGLKFVTPEVLWAVKMSTLSSWVVAPCRLVGIKRIGEIYCPMFRAPVYLGVYTTPNPEKRYV